jgi:hypothetical protein
MFKPSPGEKEKPYLKKQNYKEKVLTSEVNQKVPQLG